MKFNTALNEFLEYIEDNRAYSLYTVESYKNDIRQFCEILGEDGNIETDFLFIKANIRHFIYKLNDAGLSNKTIARKRASLMSFAKFLVKIGVLPVNPVRYIAAPKPPKPIPTFVSEPSMNLLEDTLEESETRDKLIVELLYGSGIRVSELQRMLKSRISYHYKTVKVTGKGDKERIVPLTDKSIELLKLYTAEVANPSDFVFTRTAKSGRHEYIDYGKTSEKKQKFRNTERKLLSVRRIRQIVERELSRVYDGEKKSPHVLRHSFATHLLDNGVEISYVKDLLGHQSLASTQIYTHTTMEKMLKSFKQAHPRSGAEI